MAIECAVVPYTCTVYVLCMDICVEIGTYIHINYVHVCTTYVHMCVHVHVHTHMYGLD